MNVCVFFSLLRSPNTFQLTDENLNGLAHQLDHWIVKRTVQILTGVQSGHVKTFITFYGEIDEGSRLAESNIRFLNVCRDTEIHQEELTPRELAMRLPKSIYLLRVVWTNSQFFGNTESMSHLFQCLGNRLLASCRRFINLDEIFAGKTRRGINALTESIEACELYKLAYCEASAC